jgi:hypothetical protein
MGLCRVYNGNFRGKKSNFGKAHQGIRGQSAENSSEIVLTQFHWASRSQN